MNMDLVMLLHRQFHLYARAHSYKNEHGFSDDTASTIPPTRAHSYKKVPEIVRDRRETACAYVQAPQCGTLFSGCV
eukprot:COSAG05_NODE_2487_length_3000_cov_5.221648_1_plen_76_part_00